LPIYHIATFKLKRTQCLAFTLQSCGLATVVIIATVSTHCKLPCTANDWKLDISYQLTCVFCKLQINYKSNGRLLHLQLGVVWW